MELGFLAKDRRIHAHSQNLSFHDKPVRSKYFLSPIQGMGRFHDVRCREAYILNSEHCIVWYPGLFVMGS